MIIHVKVIKLCKKKTPLFHNPYNMGLMAEYLVILQFYCILKISCYPGIHFTTSPQVLTVEIPEDLQDFLWGPVVQSILEMYLKLVFGSCGFSGRPVDYNPTSLYLLG